MVFLRLQLFFMCFTPFVSPTDVFYYVFKSNYSSHYFPLLQDSSDGLKWGLHYVKNVTDFTVAVTGQIFIPMCNLKIATKC